MSGEKDTYVNLRQSEYNRMMRSCNRMDSLESGVRSSMDSMPGNLRRDLNERVSAVNRRYDNLEHHFSGMSDEMQRIEHDHNRQMREQARVFQQGIESLGQEMYDQKREYTKMIRNHAEQVSRAMQEQRRDLEGQIRNIQDALIQKETSQRDQAAQWLNDTQIFLDMIQNEYQHEKFKPGALDRIRNEMGINQGNFDQGNFQAAIASTQQSFVRASELRLELEQLEMEWGAYLEAAKQSATEVLAVCDAQEACRFTFETEQGAEEVAGEIDFWTNGALNGLRKKVEDELKQLGAPDSLSLDDLKQAMSQSEQRRRESLDLAEQAKEALLASQLRNNIGQTIESALTDAGWEISDATYEAEDFRGSVHVKLQNLQGDEIVTIITPEAGADNTIQNKINISFFDRSTNDESFRQDRLNDIINILNKDGLDCTPPECRAGTENKPCEDNEKLDFDKVREVREVRSEK